MGCNGKHVAVQCVYVRRKACQRKDANENSTMAYRCAQDQTFVA